MDPAWDKRLLEERASRVGEIPWASLVGMGSERLQFRGRQVLSGRNLKGLGSKEAALGIPRVLGNLGRRVLEEGLCDLGPSWGRQNVGCHRG